MAGPQRLHRRFLCGKPPGKMDRGDTPAHAVCDLVLGEDATQEPLAVPFDAVSDAVDLCRVEA